MVAAQEEKVFRILDLVAEQKKDRLQRLFSAVDVVAQEQVVCRRREATHFKHAQQIGVLRSSATGDGYSAWSNTPGHARRRQS